MEKSNRTENNRCELCGFEGNCTIHHLVPRQVSRSNKYPKSLKTDESNFLVVCGVCHSNIHALFDNATLRDHYSTKEALENAPEMERYLKWRRKHMDFEGSSKMSNRRKG